MFGTAALVVTAIYVVMRAVARSAALGDTTVAVKGLEGSLSITALRENTLLKYHAVSIVTRRDGCDAVEALQGRRYLADDAPNLPLAECNVDRCTCDYVHYDDRRDDEERRDEFSFLDNPTGVLPLGERRKFGRRKND